MNDLKIVGETINVISEQEVLNHKFNIYGTFSEPYFLAKDVAEWIEHTNPSKMLVNVDEDEKTILTISYNGNMTTNQLFLTENGLYEVLMQSRKPIAKDFKKEVKKILHKIRTEGEYKINNKFVIPQTFSEALQLAANQAKQIEEQQRRIEVKDVQITEMTPKASYYDAVLSSKDALNISIIAKDYGMSGKFMNSLLHEWGIQYMCGKTWLVYKQYASMGYTKTDTPKYDKGNGEFGTTVHTKWTQKGRLFLYDIMKSHGYYPIMEQNNDNTLWN